MSEITTGPELEACGWYVRTKRTADDPTSWLVADCSAHPNGTAYAQVFASAFDLRDSLAGLLELVKLLQEYCSDRIDFSSDTRLFAARAALIKAGFLSVGD